MKKFVLFLLVLSALMSCFVFYAFHIEPKRIKVTHHVLHEKPVESSTTLLQISDIHLKEGYSTDQLQKIVEKVNQQKPDIVVFTGDLFDNSALYGPVDETIAALKAIEAPLGKFAVWGNHDYGGGASRVYDTILEAAGFQLLKNSGTRLTLANGTSLYMAGLDDSLLGQASIDTALANRNPGDYTILLSHEPDVTEYVLQQGVSLVLSGHSHGGQVKLPFLSVKNILAENYDNGFYKLDTDTTLFVNTGLGTTKISARFGVPPTIDVFHLNL